MTCLPKSWKHQKSYLVGFQIIFSTERSTVFSLLLKHFKVNPSTSDCLWPAPFSIVQSKISAFDHFALSSCRFVDIRDGPELVTGYQLITHRTEGALVLQSLALVSSFLFLFIKNISRSDKHIFVHLLFVLCLAWLGRQLEVLNAIQSHGSWKVQWMERLGFGWRVRG